VGVRRRRRKKGEEGIEFSVATTITNSKYTTSTTALLPLHSPESY